MKKILLIALLVLMASTVWAADKTVTVAESGGDYTTLQAAITGEVAENANLVTMDGVLNIAISGAWTSADTTAVDANGFTTDATHYVNIYTTGLARHSGVYSTTAYRLETTNATALTISDNNVRVNGLQIKVSHTSANGNGINIGSVSAGSTTHVVNNIIVGVFSGDDGTHLGYGIYSVDTDSSTTTYNNIIYDWKNGTLSCYGIYQYGVAIYNNTIIDCYFGIRGGTNVSIAANNLVKGSGNTNAYYGTFLTGSDNNSTDGTDTTIGGSTSQTFIFDNETGNDFHLKDNDTGAMENGKNLSAIFTTDIDGDNRTAPWDVGADQYASETPSTTTTTVAATTTTVAATTTTSVASTTTTIAPSASGNIHCVRPGLTYNGDGSTWAAATSTGGTGAFNALPVSLIRGDTYYLADGDYDAYNFNDTLDGTKYIYIKKATASAHGIDTGWNYQYGDDQAVFGTPVRITTGYLDLDGVVGSGNGSVVPHGIKIDYKWNGTDAYQRKLFNCISGSTASHVNIKHIEMNHAGDGGAGVTDAWDIIYVDSSTSTSFFTFQYCYLVNAGRCPILLRNATDYLFEYCYIKKNESTAADHAEGVSAFSTTHARNIFRYNTWEDIEGTCIFTINGASWEIYGNLFFNFSSNNAAIGTLTSTGYNLVDTKIYNNTFVNGTGYNQGTLFKTGDTGNEVYNNIWYDCAVVNFTGTQTHDYNWFYSNGTSTLTETNGQTGTGDPFTDSANNVYTLSAATNSGTTLASPYNVDLVLNVRGADGVWDIGAYEYVTGGVTTTTTTAATTTSVSTTTTAAATTSIPATPDLDQQINSCSAASASHQLLGVDDTTVSYSTGMNIEEEGDQDWIRFMVDNTTCSGTTATVWIWAERNPDSSIVLQGYIDNSTCDMATTLPDANGTTYTNVWSPAGSGSMMTSMIGSSITVNQSYRIGVRASVLSTPTNAVGGFTVYAATYCNDPAATTTTSVATTTTTVAPTADITPPRIIQGKVQIPRSLRVGSADDNTYISDNGSISMNGAASFDNRTGILRRLLSDNVSKITRLHLLD